MRRVNDGHANAATRRPTPIWVIVPAYNEAPRLHAVLRDLVDSDLDLEIVVVDDGSRDATRGVAATHPVWIVRHPINCGAGAALRTGLHFALVHGAGIIVTFDGDGQHDAADLPQLVEPILAGRADVSLGSRFLGRTVGMPLARRLLLYGARVFTRIFSDVQISDPHIGLRAMSRHAAERIRIEQDGMAHASEIVEQLRRQQLRWCEVPVTIRYSRETLAKGQSGWNAVRIVSHLLVARVVR